MSWRNELTVGLLRAERIFYGTSDGGLGSELTATELGYLDDITPGTGAASKCLVLDANADITGGIRNFNVDGDLSSDQDIFAGVDGTTYGRIYAYGGATDQGGFIRLYTAANQDDNDEFCSINCTSEQMWLGWENDLDMVIVYGPSDPGYAGIVRFTGTNGVRIDGDLDLNGDLVFGAYTITAAELSVLDGLTMGTVTASKLIGVDATRDLDAATGSRIRNLSLDGTLIVGTGDEVTINSTSLTATSFTLAGAIAVDDGSGDQTLAVGADDARRGIVNLYAGASDNGGQLTIYTSSNYDDTVNYHFMKTYAGDLWIGDSRDTTAYRISCTASNNIGMRANTYTLAPFTANNITQVNVGASDSAVGRLALYGAQGGASDSANLTIYAGADNDTNIQHFYIGFITAGGEDFTLGPSTDEDSLTYEVTANAWEFRGGTVKVGVDDVTVGLLHLYGGAGSTGGALTIYNGATEDTTLESFTVGADGAGSFVLGPNTDPDALKYDMTANQWQFSASGGVKTNDLTIDDGSGQQTLSIGADDARQGWLNLYNMGTIVLYQDSSYDATDNYFIMQGNNSAEQFTFGPNTDPDALKWDSGNARFDFTHAAAVRFSGAGGISSVGNLVIGASTYGDGTITDTGNFAISANGNTAFGTGVGGESYLTYGGATKIATASGGVSVTGTVAVGNTSLGDGYVADTGNFEVRVNSTEVAISAVANGAVSLYYDNTVMLATESDGFAWGDGTTTLSHSISGTNYVIRMNTGSVQYHITAQPGGEGGDVVAFIIDPDAATYIRYNGSDKLVTKSDGVDITGECSVTSLELNSVVVTASGTELNYLDIAALGTGAASKAVVLDANGDYIFPATTTGIDLATNSAVLLLGDGDWSIGGTTITANGAELNYLDIAALGTGAVSKAVVLDSNGNYVFPANTTAIDFKTNSATVDLGAGDWKVEGVAVASTAAELDTFYLNIHIPDISTNTYAAVVVPEACTFEKVESVLWGTIATADDTLTFTTSSGAVTNTLVIAYSGSAAGDIDTMTPGDNQTCSAGSVVSLSNSAGSTNSVPVTLTLHFKRS